MSLFHESGCDIHTFVDLTVGAGGHAHHLLKSMPSIRRYIGVDRDAEALSVASERLHEFGDRVSLLHGNFSNIGSLLDKQCITMIDGAILDAGVSSMQLDDGGRGFSYMRDGPLDMRMDGGGGMSALEVVNGLSVSELTRALQVLGEERQAGRIAREIERTRSRKPIETTGELVEVVMRCKRWERRGKHPAARTFQAIRMVVNGELEALHAGIEAVVERLRAGGRLAVLTFHSGEDRVVKHLLRDMESREGGVRWVDQRKCVEADDDERRRNSRSRSAKLRRVEKMPRGVRGRRSKRNKYEKMTQLP